MGVSRAFKFGAVALAAAVFVPGCADPKPASREEACANERSQIVAALRTFKFSNAAGRYPVAIGELVPKYLAHEPTNYHLAFDGAGGQYTFESAGDCLGLL